MIARAFPLTAGFLPPALRQARRPQRVLEHHWIVGKSGFVWVLIGGFFEPFFYLISTKLGFGSLISDIDVNGQTVNYVAFVAPALLAASAMNGAMYETMNVFFRLTFEKTYSAMLATPMTTGDVVVGDSMWATIRGTMYALGFLAVMLATGITLSWWALLVFPVALVISAAFAAIGMTVATFMRAIEDFEYVPTLSLPLFLFSATFFPPSAYGSLSWLLHLSPLYHGVAVMRGLCLGQPSWGMFGHVAVLASIAVIGTVVSARRIERTLLS